MMMEWDKVGEKFVHTGVSKVGIAKRNKSGNYPTAVAFSGVTSIEVSNDGGDTTKYYADNGVWMTLGGTEQKQISLSCYTYPDEFAECNGEYSSAPGVTITQQRRLPFGMFWRTEDRSDADQDTNEYRIHIAYGCTSQPADFTFDTEEDDIEPVELDFDIETEPVKITGHRDSSYIIISSRRTDAAKMKELENILYGTDATAPRIPLPDEINALFNTANRAATYTSVTPAAGDNPASKGWYELSGTTYVLTTDTTVQSGKTYYSVSV